MALRTLAELASGGREPDRSDLASLAHYSGWGGAPQAFDEREDAPRSWREVNDVLRSLMSEEEYAEARSSSLTAFYTPGPVIRSVLGFAERIGFPVSDDAAGDVRVIEPGCGIGNFISASEGTGWRFDGIEVDGTSAEIARLLNPGANILCASLDRVRIAPGSYDLVLGNVPFSDSIRFDPPEGDGRASVAIHDYFIQRGVDALRPGGIAALITSRYTMDKRGEATRRWLAQRAELLGAVRLPAETFGLQAGTDAVTDLLLLRKREELVEDPDEPWVAASGMAAPDGSTVPVNRYFLDHHEHVIGELSLGLGRFGYAIDVRSGLDAAAIAGSLAAALESIAASAVSAGKGYGAIGARASAPTCVAVPDPADTAFSYVLDGAGGVWYGSGDAVEPVELPDQDASRLSAMVRLRDRQLELLALERSSDDEEVVARAIAELDGAYEAFVESYGHVTSPKNRRVWATESDYSGAFLRSLEVTDALGRVVGKGDILVKRVQSPVGGMPEHVDSARDALTVSLDQRQRVDMGLICRISGKDEAEVLGELGDALVRDPFTGEAVLADAFLSGDVGEKLRRLDALIDDAEHGRDRALGLAWEEECGIAVAAREVRARLAPRMADVRARLNANGGAWESWCHPDAALSYGDLDAMASSGLHERWVAVETKAAILFAMLDDADRGTVLRRPDGGASYLWNLAAEGERGGWRGAESAIALREVARRGDLLGDEELAFFLQKSSYLSSPAFARCLLSVLGPDFELPEPRYSPDRSDEYLRLAKALRSDPDILDYIAIAAVGMERESRRRGGLSRIELKGLPELELGDAAGLANFKRAKAAFVAERGGDYPKKDPDEIAELKALRARLVNALPARLDASEVSVNLGAPWIPLRYYYEFAAETFGFDTACRVAYAGAGPRSKWVVARSPETGTWQFRRGGAPELMPEVLDRFGVPEMHPLSLMESAMNGSVISITKEDPSGGVDERGNPKRVKDPAATAAAYHKRDAICQAFKEWCISDPKRARELAQLYNDRFNGIAQRSYDGSYITLPGSNPAIKLRAHQKDAVARVLQSEEGTLIAHSVGAGKTFAGIASVMESRRTGRASKPLVVVPNHLTEQWAGDFLRLYPSARVLAMTRADIRNQDTTRDFWARAAAGDWDAVIVGQSRFDMLGLSAERKKESTQRRISELESSIASAKKDGLGFTVKQLEAARKRAERTLEKLRDARQTEGMDFESCGFDFLLVDEAHGYKNLAIVGRSVAGMSSTSSKKCENLVDVCDYLREAGCGGNIVFATGTPVSNSMCELYNMQRYLAPSLLKAQGVYVFSDWAQSFGETVQSVEVKPESNGFVVKERFAKFHNLPELMAGFHLFADIMTADDLDLDVPEVDAVTVAVEASDEQKELVKRLGERADVIRSGGVDPSVDNLLKITSEGRALALSPRLVDGASGGGPYGDEGGKLQACAENIYNVWAETSGVRGTQLVFCDASTPARGRWNVYDEIKAQIIGMGIPEKEIAFVHDCGNDPAKRDALFERVNAGEVRVLFGSTQKLGTGTNVQARLAAIHDVDCPWRPSDLEQRLGRIQRQGNMFDAVRDFRYVTTGTFDSYLYQTVERKQRFISQVFTNRCPARSGDDLDETVLDFATIKAVAAGDPKVRERLQREVRLQELELQRQSFFKSRQAAASNVVTRFAPAVEALEETVRNLEDDRAALGSALERMRAYKAADLPCDVSVGGVRDAEQGRQAARIVGIYASARDDLGSFPCYVPVGEFCGMAFGLRFSSRDDCRVYIEGEHRYSSEKRLSLQTSGPETCLRQLERLIEKTGGGLDTAKERLAGARERLRQAQDASEAVWEYAEEYDELARRHEADLREQLAAPDSGGGCERDRDVGPKSPAERMAMACRAAASSVAGAPPARPHVLPSR